MIVRQKAASEFPAGLLVFLSLALIFVLVFGLFQATRNGELNVPREVNADDLTQTATGTAPEELTFNILGSLEANQGVRRYLDRKGIDSLFAKLTPYLGDAVSNMLVLEGPLSLLPDGKECFYLDDLDALKKLNFNLFPAANQYFAAPKGDTATLQQQALQNAEINFYGLGRNLNDAARGVRYEIDGTGISFFSASAIGRGQRASRVEPGMAIASDIQLFDRVTRAKINGDFVVVTLHWGNLLGAETGTTQRDLAYRYIDAGADLVIGATPGHAMPIEEYRGSLICYNLGSLLQDRSQGQRNPALLMQLTVNQDAPQLRFYPLTQRYGLPVFSDTWQSDILRESFLQNVDQLNTVTHDDGSFTVYFPESERR